MCCGLGSERSTEQLVAAEVEVSLSVQVQGGTEGTHEPTLKFAWLALQLVVSAWGILRSFAAVGFFPG